MMGKSLLARTRRDQRVRLISMNFEQCCEIQSEELASAAMEPRRGWANYPLGILHHLALEGAPPPGLDLLFAGEVEISGDTELAHRFGEIPAAVDVDPFAPPPRPRRSTSFWPPWPPAPASTR